MRKFAKLSWILWFAFLICSCASDKDNKQTKTAANDSSQSSGAASQSSGAASDAAGSYSLESTGTLGNVVERTKYDDAAMEAVNATSDDIESALKTADSGNTDSAIASLKSVTQKYPKSFIAHYDLGLMYERKNDVNNAKNAYQSALNAEPRFYQPLAQMVRIDIRNGNASSGLNTANRYISSHPDIFDYNYAKLEAMIALKQYDEAILLCRSLLKKDEANAKLRYYLALSEFERGRYRLAEFIVGESLDIDANDADALFLRARIHNALSEDDVSLIPGIASTLDQVLAISPDHMEALWMRANIYYNASNYAKAEELYRHILRLNPDLVGAHINLANTLKTVNQGPQAETLLKRAQSLDPNNGLVYFALGTLYLNFELIKLPMPDMDRLKLARQQFELAQKNWHSKDDIALAKGYIKTTDDAIETLQAMLDAEALFGTSSDADESGSDGQSGSMKVD